MPSLICMGSREDPTSLGTRTNMGYPLAIGKRIMNIPWGVGVLIMTCPLYKVTVELVWLNWRRDFESSCTGGRAFKKFQPCRVFSPTTAGFGKRNNCGAPSPASLLLLSHPSFSRLGASHSFPFWGRACWGFGAVLLQPTLQLGLQNHFFFLLPSRRNRNEWTWKAQRYIFFFACKNFQVVFFFFFFFSCWTSDPRWQFEENWHSGPSGGIFMKSHPSSREPLTAVRTNWTSGDWTCDVFTPCVVGQICQIKFTACVEELLNGKAHCRCKRPQKLHVAPHQPLDAVVFD